MLGADLISMLVGLHYRHNSHPSFYTVFGSFHQPWFPFFFAQHIVSSPPKPYAALPVLRICKNREISETHTRLLFASQIDLQPPNLSFSRNTIGRHHNSSCRISPTLKRNRKYGRTSRSRILIPMVQAHARVSPTPTRFQASLGRQVARCHHVVLDLLPC